MPASEQIRFPDVKSAARGRWADILAGLGIDPGSLRNKHGPCPGCGGRDRFRFDDQEEGRFFCGGGGEPTSGDGFTLLQHVHGWSPREALAHVAAALHMGGPIPSPILRRKPPTRPVPVPNTGNYAREIWRRSATDDATVGAHPYARKKGIDWAAGAGRARASGLVIGRKADCLVVPVRTLGGTLTAVQCINPRGEKQTFGPIKGGCLLLGNTLDRSIPWYVSEGWASAVSVVFHHHNGNAVCAVAFGNRQLLPVARMLDAAFGVDITVLEEQDG